MPPQTQYQAPAPALNVSHTGRTMAIVFAVLFLLALGAGAAAGYYQYQQAAALRADLEQANTELASSTAQVASLEAMVTRLSCEGTWVENRCQNFVASLVATPGKGVAPLKVSFVAKVPKMSFVLDFGDASTTDLKSAECTPTEGNLCVIKVEHTYVSATADQAFGAKILKGTESVAGAVVIVSPK